eukprot:3896337-Pleurochrysis_carterae.AAC.1
MSFQTVFSQSQGSLIKRYCARELCRTFRGVGNNFGLRCLAQAYSPGPSQATGQTKLKVNINFLQSGAPTPRTNERGLTAY